MKHISTLLIFTFCMITVAEIWPQESLTKRQLEKVNTIEINDGLIVFITQATDNSISATEDILSNLDYNLLDGKLKISQGKALPQSKIYLSISNLEKIVANGIAEVISANELSTAYLNLITTGAAKANILFEGEKLRLEGSGASEIRASGKTNDLIVDLSGISNLRAFKLRTSSAKVDVSGSAVANINAEAAQINGNVSGVSTLYYSGEPVSLNLQASGMAKVKKSNGLEVERGDTTKLSIGRRKIIIYDKGDEKSLDIEIDGHNKRVPDGTSPPKTTSLTSSIWSGFELGINGYVNNQRSLGLEDTIKGFDLDYTKAIAVNINPFEYKIRILNENIFFVTGLGMEINNYRFNSNMRMVPNTRPLETVLDDDLSYEKNKLTMVFINAPLYLSLKTPAIGQGKQFSISPGITAGWLVRSYQKRVIEGDGRNKIRTRDNFNLQPFRLNASLRISYSKFTVFGNYSINEMFYRGRGPELYPFSVGVRIVGLDW